MLRLVNQRWANALSFVGPNRKLVASRINIFKAPSSREREDILRNSAPGLDDSRFGRLKVRRVKDHERRGRTMRRVGINAGTDAAALSVHIVVPPILKGPSENFAIEGLACSKGFGGG